MKRESVYPQEEADNFFCRLKINQDTHEFILEIGTIANSTCKWNLYEKSDRI
jgi:hypothetical protein